MRRDAVVAIEFQIVERGGDAEPARHVGRFDAAHASDGDGDDVTAAHGAADQNNFQFDICIHLEALRAKEENAGGADVAGDQGNREFFLDIFHAPQAQRKPQRCARVFSLFVKDADSVSRNAGEAANRDCGFGAQRNDS